VLLSLAAAIALGAIWMNGIALLAHLAPAGRRAERATVRRALDLAGPPAGPPAA
jgi:hypothetical protein